MTSRDRPTASSGETRAPLVDAVEILAVVAVPAVGLAAVTAVGGQGPVAGLILGAVVGAGFASFRRAMVAVRTPDGIERRLRRYDADPEANPWVRLATVEYDRRWALVLAASCGVLGVAALVAVILFAEDYRSAARLLAVALFGIVAGLGALGVYSLR